MQRLKSKFSVIVEKNLVKWDLGERRVNAFTMVKWNSSKDAGSLEVFGSWYELFLTEAVFIPCLYSAWRNGLLGHNRRSWHDCNKIKNNCSECRILYFYLVMLKEGMYSRVWFNPRWKVGYGISLTAFWITSRASDITNAPWHTKPSAM